MLLFIKIEHTGGEAGLGEENELGLELIAFKLPSKMTKSYGQ
jgi:hypothetical protein